MNGRARKFSEERRFLKIFMALRSDFLDNYGKNMSPIMPP